MQAPVSWPVVLSRPCTPVPADTRLSGCYGPGGGIIFPSSIFTPFL